MMFVFGMAGRRVVAPRAAMRSVAMALFFYIDDAGFFRMVIIVGGYGNTDRGTDGPAGDGAVAAADFRADRSPDAAADGATQYCITIHRQCGCARQCPQG